MAHESTTTSPEDLDTFIAEVRLPALQALRAQLTVQLVAMYQAIGLEMDHGWKATEDAGEVRRLLTGSAAPAEATMPLPALHAVLDRRRDNVDRALHIAQMSLSRVEVRKREARIAAARDEIDGLERQRISLARQLATVNRKRADLREKLSAGLSFGFETDRVTELNAIDDVLLGPVLERALASGLLTRKDLKDERAV